MSYPNPINQSVGDVDNMLHPKSSLILSIVYMIYARFSSSSHPFFMESDINLTSRGRENQLQEVGKPDPNYTDYNYTKQNYTDMSYPVCQAPGVFSQQALSLWPYLAPQEPLQPFPCCILNLP
mgnify:CR=1 FL=1